MEVAALRTWGLVASAAALASALTIAALGGCEDRTGMPPPPAETPTEAPAVMPTVTPRLDEPIAQPSASETPPQPLASPRVRVRPSFIVRFEPPHPLARAQEIAAQGRMEEAVRTANAALRSRADMRGLCFERFTLGAAEIVVAACNGVTNADVFQRRWITRLNAMRGVAYAEANAIAQPEVRAN
ncbi:MAG: hypothetical protein ABW199_04120 [Caulobacterales bacterium]